MRSLTVLLVLVSASAHAQAVSELDYIEKIFGATNVNAVAGHGGLTAGISADGDITVLSWPSPGFADQLQYVSSNDLQARAMPHMGALDGMGSYIGLSITIAGQTRLTWLRDAAWTHSQSYSQPDAPVPVTRFERDDLGLVVTVTDIVSPDIDALSRHVVVTRQAGSPVDDADLVVYENLSPSLSRIPELPLADWALDYTNDFFAVWDDDAQAILHFHPSDNAVFSSFGDLVGLTADVNYGAVETLMKEAQPSDDDVASFTGMIDDLYTSGVAAMVTIEPMVVSHQVGGDATPLCVFLGTLLDNILALPTEYPDIQVPLTAQSADILRCTDALPRLQAGHSWLWQPQDALANVANLGTAGALSGSSVAAGQVNGALQSHLDFANDEADATVLFTFGTTRADARAALDSARGQAIADRQAAAEKASHDALAGLPLPDPSLGARVAEVAQRALVNLYVARDRTSGAFLASITRQPPYYLDWPRDGAFLADAIDIGGMTPALDWVTVRQTWYTTLIRTDFTAGNPVLTPNVPIDPDSGMMLFPRYAWEMNYFVDGYEGGPIRFEIDNTSLHVWATVVHVATLQGDARKAFAATVWPTDKEALDLLVRWKDAKTGLPAPANEDDNYALTQSLHGAAAVYTALIAGARLAHYMADDTSANSYVARANELAAAIRTAYYNPATGLYRTGTGAPGAGDLDPTAWLVWPARYFQAGDPDLERQLSADMTAVLSELSGNGPGATYSAKNVLAAALYGSPTGSQMQARMAVNLLADIATADTSHFGEVFIPVPDPTGMAPFVWSNRTATPHVWEGMLFYLAAMALSDPARFNPEERELPLPSHSSGCAIGATRDPGAGGVAFFVAILLFSPHVRRFSRRRA